jgi:hypothetical protein
MDKKDKKNIAKKNRPALRVAAFRLIRVACVNPENGDFPPYFPPFICAEFSRLFPPFFPPLFVPDFPPFICAIK